MSTQLRPVYSEDLNQKLQTPSRKRDSIIPRNVMRAGALACNVFQQTLKGFTMTKFGLAALVAATLGSTCVATASKAETYIYAVSVKTNFGTRFNDCFTFDKGTLTVAGLGNLTYAAAPTDPVHFYSAVPGLKLTEEIGFNIAFAGFKTGTPMVGKLHAVGSNNHQDAYVVEGNAVASCAASDATPAGSRYLSQAK